MRLLSEEGLIPGPQSSMDWAVCPPPCSLRACQQESQPPPTPPPPRPCPLSAHTQAPSMTGGLAHLPINLPCRFPSWSSGAGV